MTSTSRDASYGWSVEQAVHGASGAVTRPTPQNRFRAARGRILHDQIANLAKHLGRSIVILDVGGCADYWSNVGFDNIAAIRLLNNDENDFGEASRDLFTCEFGDARNLSNYADKSVDLVHSNSVIEHVGRAVA